MKMHVKSNNINEVCLNYLTPNKIYMVEAVNSCETMGHIIDDSGEEIGIMLKGSCSFLQDGASWDVTVCNNKHVHYSLIMQWAYGAKIQQLTECGWIDITNPIWEETSEYRIKPEPVCELKKGKFYLVNLECGINGVASLVSPVHVGVLFSDGSQSTYGIEVIKSIIKEIN